MLARQRYSKYLPLQQRASRATSLAGSIVKEGTKSPKSTSSKTRAESAHAAAKRRSTMNSRDAAYDDEQLRRAIEASKEETALDTVEDGPRRPKRGRSDSEECVCHPPCLDSKLTAPKEPLTDKEAAHKFPIRIACRTSRSAEPARVRRRVGHPEWPQEASQWAVPARAGGKGGQRARAARGCEQAQRAG